MSNSIEDQLIKNIWYAFETVTLEDGISLNMAEYYDSAVNKEYLEKAEFDERVSWQAIADKTLEQFIRPFTFTDPKGYRFYLPAYMIWTIRRHTGSTSILSDSTIYALRPDHLVFEQGNVDFYEWFTAEQLDCIIAFLKYCTENDRTLDSRVAKENLQKIIEGKEAR